MADGTNSTISSVDENAAAFVRKCQAESAAQLAAFKALHHVDPLEFLGNRQPKIRALLGLLAENFNNMPETEAEELIWLCFDLAKEIEGGIDLVNPPPAAEGGANAGAVAAESVTITMSPNRFRNTLAEMQINLDRVDAAVHMIEDHVGAPDDWRRKHLSGGISQDVFGASERIADLLRAAGQPVLDI